MSSSILLPPLALCLLTWSWRSPAESEIKRQIADIEAGRPVVQATRGFDAVSGETFHLRGKEDAPDYRYMPDPELGPILVTEVGSQD